MLQRLLDLALFRRANHRRLVLFGKVGWQLNVKIHLACQSGRRIEIVPLNDFDFVSRDAALLAKAKHVDTGAGANRRKEKLERTWRGILTPCAGWYTCTD
jgi:hypothetical protein